MTEPPSFMSQAIAEARLVSERGGFSAGRASHKPKNGNGAQNIFKSMKVMRFNIQKVPMIRRVFCFHLYFMSRERTLPSGGKLLSPEWEEPHMAEHNPQSPRNGSAEGARKARTSPENGSHKTNGGDWRLAMGGVPEAMRGQAEAWFKEQADLFGGMQDMMAARMKRCQDGTEAAFRTLERIRGCTDGADAMVAFNEWLLGGMAFFMADIAATYEQATRMTLMGRRTLSAFPPTGALAAAA